MSDIAQIVRVAIAVVAPMIMATTVVTAQTTEPEQEKTPPPHVLRGDQVEATYKAYVQRLARYQTRLRSHLQADAPDLAEKLKKEPPKPVEYGYLVVPAYSVREPAAPSRPRSAGYNWPWTSQMIDREQANVATAEQTLDKVDGLAEAERRTTYETLTDGYPTLEKGQRLVDSHLKHNRFWQQVIADDRPRFERLRVLHDAVVERGRLLAQARAADVTPDNKASLEQRAAALAKQVEDGQPGPAAPDYIQIIENTPQRRVLRVPLYTDIPDAEFVTAAVTAIESAWSVDAEDIEYRLEVDLRTKTPEELYPDMPPERGTHINLNAHVKLFPADGGVLTTGSNRTYAIPGRFVSVGPSPLNNRTMAHEFGHILGFTDRYLRGARDLGRSGFGIMEIVPDGRDIMAAPGSGLVRQSHFDQLIAAVTKKAAATKTAAP
jgi:hypothetical protein